MKIQLFLLSFVAMTLQTSLYASDSLQIASDQMLEFYQVYLDSIESTLSYQKDQVTLDGNIATIAIPPGFKYLNGKDSDMVLTDVWGNPPNEDLQSLGMLLPADHSVLDDSIYVINITYVDDGYIDDEDAKDLDYEELLETMKEDVAAASEYRKENGYEGIELIGWASAPFYDAENKKLHWAKELKFESMDVNTLNYNIRVLGRKGYLNLNAIGDMHTLDEIKNNINPILSSVDFTDGNRYADFDSNLDKVAAVGIGGLIAGKVLAKAGILAKLGIVLAKFWKVIALGFIAFGAGVKKFFSRKKKEEIS